MKILAYQKQSDDPSILGRTLNQISVPGCEYCTVYTDSDRDFIAYKELKNEISDDTLLVIASIRDLGHNKQEVIRELTWYKERKINVVVSEYPSMLEHLQGEENRTALSMLIDMCRTLLDDNTFEFQDYAQSRSGGRKKMAFPPNWEELYAAWKNKEITAAEFMKRAGVKKGTFYHLVTEYSEIMSNMKEIRKIG